MSILMIVRILQVVATLLGLFSFSSGQTVASNMSYGATPEVWEWLTTGGSFLGSVATFGLSWFLSSQWNLNSDLTKSVIDLLVKLPSIVKLNDNEPLTADQKSVVSRVLLQLVDLICNKVFPEFPEVRQTGQAFVTSVLKAMGLISTIAPPSAAPAERPLVAGRDFSTVSIPSQG